MEPQLPGYLLDDRPLISKSHTTEESPRSARTAEYRDIGDENAEHENLKCQVKSTGAKFSKHSLKYFSAANQVGWIHYSQMGEDSFAVQHFFSRDNLFLTNGTYFEIGAYKGKEISNTYFLMERLGWSGFLVEAGKVCREIFSFRDSKKDHIYCKAVCEPGVQSIAFVDVVGTGGMVDETDAEIVSHHRMWNDGWAKTTVPCITLGRIFAEHPTTQLDFVSLDMEGGELFFLRLFPFDVIKVGVWVIERHHRNETVSLLQSKGYCFRGRDRGNLWFYHPDYVSSLRQTFYSALGT